MYVCAPTWIYVYQLCAGAQIERHWIPQSWSYIQAVVGSLVWVLGREVGSSARAESADHTESSLQHQEIFLKDSKTEELKKRHESPTVAEQEASP